VNGDFLADLLIDPETGEPLSFDAASNTFVSIKSGKRFPLIESIPKIIAGENQDIAKSGIHEEYGTVFNYCDHYQKDAKFFTYSDDNSPDITQAENVRLHESINRVITSNMSVVLDVGCGSGWFSKKLIPRGMKVISMDISPENPVKALRALPDKNHAGLIADAYNIPLKENSVDCIIASEVLEHVPDPKSFITKLVRILKPGGKLIITTPYNEKTEYSICVHCNRPTPRFAHLHSFNEENISKFIPEGILSWSVKSFMNKQLIQIRSHVVLRYFPFGFWRLTDRLFNFLFRNPLRLRVVIVKKL